MATTDNELNDLIINDISQEEYDNLVATGQVQEGQIYATDGTGGGSTTGGLESVAHDSSLEGAGTTASPLKVASTVIAQINDKADGTVVETLSSAVSENTTKLNTLRNDTDSLGDQVSGIEEKIPSSASATNQLATKADLPIGFDATVVDQLPATGEKGIIYLVPKDGEAPDVHDEYIWIDSEQKFEFIGSTAVDLTDYVKNTDYATGSKAGVIKSNVNLGTNVLANGTIYCVQATQDDISAKENKYKPIVSSNLDLAVKTGVTTNTITLTDEEKAAAQAWLGVESGGGDYLPLSGGTLTGSLSFEKGTSNYEIEPTTYSCLLFSINGKRIFDIDAMAGIVPNGDKAFGLGRRYRAWKNVYTTKLNNGADLIVPTEGGTLARLEDLEGLGGASLPILMTMWSDHVINDMSWLRADTFSWQSGDVYKTAYEHLVNDVGEVWYAWAEIGGGYWYTKTPTVSVGDTVYNDDFSVDGQVDRVFSDTNFTVGASEFNRSVENDIPAHKTDTIGDITITYYQADDGHKICLPDQESNLIALYEATGVAWYFILDTENKQFKLPRAKPLNGAVVGNGMTLGLTNGTRNFGTEVIPTSSLAAASDIYGANISTSGTTGASGDAGIVGITTDPTKSGIIAERDNTDQHKYLYFYVGNFEQTAVEQTAGLNAELFNGKADVSRVEVLEGYDYVVESQEPTADNNYTWYRKYKSGWVEQAGYWKGNISIAQYNVKTVDITLPIEMSDGNYYAAAECNTLNHVRVNTGYGTRVNTSTTMKVNIKEILNSTGTITRVEWYVCGQSA